MTKLTCHVNGHKYVLSHMNDFAIGITILECKNCGETKEIQNITCEGNIPSDYETKDKDDNITQQDNGNGDK